MLAGLKRWIRWRAFRNAPVRFHTDKDRADPTIESAVLREGFKTWARKLKSKGFQQSEMVTIHRVAIHQRIASGVYRDELLELAASGKELLAESEPRGTVFCYRSKLTWGRILFGRAIDLTLLRIDFQGGVTRPRDP